MRAPVLATLVLLAAPAEALELRAAAGLAAQHSDWRGDAGALSVLELSIVPLDWASLYFLGRLGYALVDERLMTFVSLGARIWPLGQRERWRPYGRLAVAHQHEEPLIAVAAEPLGAIFGIGDGIRHRAGFEGGLGFDFLLEESEDLDLYLGAESFLTWFFDDRGPHLTGGAQALLGLSYDP